MLPSFYSFHAPHRIPLLDRLIDESPLQARHDGGDEREKELLGVIFNPCLQPQEFPESDRSFASAASSS